MKSKSPPWVSWIQMSDLEAQYSTSIIITSYYCGQFKNTYFHFISIADRAHQDLRLEILRAIQTSC